MQRGVSLVFALMALVVISLGAVAIVRSVDTGALVIGNLGFKQDATSAAAQAAETGQSTASGKTVVAWSGSGSCSGNCVTPSPELTLNGGANKARYVITRLCAVEGDPTVIDCAVPIGAQLTGGGNKGVESYGKQKIETLVSTAQYYRIVVRATSARGTVSFTETIVQL